MLFHGRVDKSLVHPYNRIQLALKTKTTEGRRGAVNAGRKVGGTPERQRTAWLQLCGDLERGAGEPAKNPVWPGAGGGKDEQSGAQGMLRAVTSS